MSPLLLLPILARLRRQGVGRRIERVLPAARHGLHVVLTDGPPGIRLDTRPGGGALLTARSAPRRLRGGRSAWPDATAVADRGLDGLRLSGVDVAPGLAAVTLRFEAGAALVWRGGDHPGIGVLTPGQPSRALPPGTDPPVPSQGTVLDDLSGAAEALAAWVGAAAESGVADEDLRTDLEALLPGLGTRAAMELTRAAREHPDAVRRWAAALRGEPLHITVDPGRPGNPPSVRPLLGGGTEIGDAVEAWYAAAVEAEELQARRRRAADLLRSERRRVERALAAVEKDARKAGDPQILRHRADALLAAGPAAEPMESGGGWRVPDPWDPSAVLEVDADPPGASLHETAEKLYGRARRAERGMAAREERRRSLERRREALEGVRARLDRADGAGNAEALAPVEEALEQLGLAAREDHAAASAGKGPGRSRKGAGGQPAPPARAFTSPGGFRVLVGRNARQNDVLTFKVAAPDDLWLHARDRAGAHVVIRTAGARQVPDPDIRYAAELAAAWSRAPQGERVEVHVARRKHVRKLKGGAPGQVTVRKAWTVSVTTPAPPNPDDTAS